MTEKKTTTNSKKAAPKAKSANKKTTTKAAHSSKAAPKAKTAVKAKATTKEATVTKAKVITKKKVTAKPAEAVPAKSNASVLEKAYVAQAEVATLEEPKKVKVKRPRRANEYYGTGRRKSSKARVYLRPGNGEIVINDRKILDYFDRQTARIIATQPLTVTDTRNKFDILAIVDGGGMSGQAGAVSLGIARALLQYELATTATAEQDGGEIKQLLRRAGYLTRDAREVERKKVGKHGARRGTQFSKR